MPRHQLGDEGLRPGVGQRRGAARPAASAPDGRSPAARQPGKGRPAQPTRPMARASVAAARKRITRNLGGRHGHGRTCLLDPRFANRADIPQLGSVATRNPALAPNPGQSEHVYGSRTGWGKPLNSHLVGRCPVRPALGTTRPHLGGSGRCPDRPAANRDRLRFGHDSPPRPSRCRAPGSSSREGHVRRHRGRDCGSRRDRR